MVGRHFVCTLAKTGSVLAVDAFSTSPNGWEIVLSTSELKLVPVLSIDNYFVAHSSQKSYICSLSKNALKIVKTIDRPTLFVGAYYLKENSNTKSVSFAAFYESQNVINVHDLDSGKADVQLRLSTKSGQAPLKELHLMISSPGFFQVLTVRADCEVGFFEGTAHLTADSALVSADLVLEWVRFEALASISSAEMIDLPLSESQAQIETEFGLENGGYKEPIKNINH